MGDESKFHPKLLEKASRFTGTNCKNCKFYLGKSEKDADKTDLNSQGGIDPKGEEQLARAKAADLITLPGDNIVLKKAYCHHPDVKLTVTPKMCCAFWDNGDAIRPWEDLSKAEEETAVEVPHRTVMANSLPHRQDD